MFKSFREDWQEERYVRSLKIFNVLSFGFLVLSTFLIYGGIVGHQSIFWGTEKYLTYLTPARWAFGIMSVILFLQLVYTIFQSLPHDTEKAPYIVRLNFFLPACWIFEAISLYFLAFDVMWASFVFTTLATVSLGVSYFRLNSLPLQLAHVMAARIDGREKAVASFYYLIFYAPTSLNFSVLICGWVLQGFMMLKSFHVNLPVALGIIASVLATVVSFIILGTKKDTLFALASSWVLFGVGMKWWGFPAIQITNLICAGVVFLATLATFIASARKTPNLLEKENIETYRARATGYQTGIHVHPTDTSRLVST